MDRKKKLTLLHIRNFFGVFVLYIVTYAIFYAAKQGDNDFITDFTNILNGLDKVITNTALLAGVVLATIVTFLIPAEKSLF